MSPLRTGPLPTRRERNRKMDKTPLAEIASMSGAKLLRDALGVTVSNISKDTRTIRPGDLYIGLRGDNFDGNAFAAQAIEKGAAAVLLDSPEEAERLSGSVPVLLAENSLVALTKLAAAWRAKLNLKVLGITGSSGKTSTKEFAAAVLGSKFKVIKTRGNLNNHIGVPLSILAASSSDKAAVWEIGMNHPGEIAPLAALAKPDCAIITNIGTAHIEYMKNRDAIALEKGMLAEAVPAGGSVILSAEDDKTESIAARCRAKVIRTGLTGGSLTATEIVPNSTGTTFKVLLHSGERTASAQASIPVQGLHMVQNALMAIAAGLELGIPLESAVKGLARTELAAGRLEQRTHKGVTFLDDTYNANPDSMEAALSTLRLMPTAGRRIAVLGKMGELGEYAAEGYFRTGCAAAKYADVLVTVGAEARQISEAARGAGLSRIHEVEDTSAAARILDQLARSGDLVLVKGSRSAQMETLFQKLQS
jgi:UDP-N-acetylmuramoyl-tripeptide--D-alanyl-D-alanine ligase